MDENICDLWTREEEELQRLLSTCDIPRQRRRDINWLSRNLLIHNRTDNAFKAHKIILNILRWEKLRW